MGKKISEMPDFDMAAHLKSEEDIAAYLTIVIEDGDPGELAHALE
jgi:DNA-binding phage protein